MFIRYAKFPLGQVVVTRGILKLFESVEVSVILHRHASGDWGELCREDKELNEIALTSKRSRLFSAYETSKGRVWVITECDYSITTVLLPDEY